jgi:hypothetical protein
VAGTKPEQQEAALGTAESTEPKADSNDCGRIGAAAKSRAIARLRQKQIERVHGGSGATGVQDQDDSGRGSTPDTARRMNVAAQNQGQDTGSMAVPIKRGSLSIAAIALAASVCAYSARADEIRLKDGKKLNGVIVGYEENMFKVKTDFGYVLVEKDKIASIIPSGPSAEKTKSGNAKKDSKEKAPSKNEDGQAESESETPPDADAVESPKSPQTKPVSAKNTEKAGKASPKIVNTSAKPEIPTKTSAAPTPAPEIKIAGTSTAPVTATSAAAPPPKEPEVPANREEIQGNLYINYTHGFKMYKAPSWNLIEEARGALPNAIVAMGTANESTLMVIGKEKTKESLDGASAEVEKRLHDVYSNYKQLSQKKTTVSGLPAIVYQYRGKADEHDWSGRLVVIAHGPDIFTVLAMTYADSDLIQIQENVISRSITSLEFTAR